MNKNKSLNNLAAKPDLKPNKRLSPVWLLPLLALILGGYLTYQSIQESGIMIQIHFENGEGIIEGKTPVKYKGLSIGKVHSIQPDRRLSGVNVLVEMDPRAEQALTKDTQFWLVKPQASLTQISGLDTILSGNYIGIQPGGGAESRTFQAVVEPPVQIADGNLLVQLSAEDSGGINVGAPVYHKHIIVGDVVQVQLDKSGETTRIQLQIKSEYKHLIKQGSRFWNVSGIKFNAGLGGLELQAESLATLIAGGIAFDSPSQSEPITFDHTPFTLYPSLNAASLGVKFNLILPNIEGLSQGTPIQYLGMKLGQVDGFNLIENEIHAEASISLEMANLLGDDTQFWLVKPTVSASGVQHLDTLITGYKIQLSPASQSSNKRSFNVQQRKPDPKESLHISLRADESFGVTPDTQVHYKGLTIGRVSHLSFDNGNQLKLQLVIAPEYRELIGPNSRFYVESAAKLSANLAQGIELDINPIATILSGGISLIPGENSTDEINDDLLFKLFANKKSAMANRSESLVQLTLMSKKLDGLQLGAPLYFKEVPIGQVKAIDLTTDDELAIELTIKEQYANRINDSSKFWQHSGVDLKASFTGVELKTPSLMAMALGGISVETPDDLAPQQRKQFQLYESRSTALGHYQHIRLTAPLACQIKAGAAVRYGGFKIGEVSVAELAEDLNHIQLEIRVKNRYADSFLRDTAQFWLESAELGLAGVRNASTLITGNFVAARPGAGAVKNEFKLLAAKPSPRPEDEQLVLYLKAKRLAGLQKGSPVLYRQKEVGSVLQTELEPDGHGVSIQIAIEPRYTHLVRSSSQFWNASGVKADIGLFSGVELEADSLQTIVIGGIAFTTPIPLEGEPKATFGSRFTLHTKAKQEWLK